MEPEGRLDILVPIACSSTLKSTSKGVFVVKIHTLLSIGAASVLLAAGQASAVSYTYDFSGNLSDQFTLAYSTSGHSASSQSGGQLVYNTVGAPDLFDDVELFAHTFTPTFDQSWYAEITATVPVALGAGAATNAANSISLYAEAFLGVQYQAADGTVYSLSNILGLWDAAPYTDRHYSPQYAKIPLDSQWVEIRPLNQGLTKTGDESGLLGLRFDAQSKVLTAYNANQVLMNIAINSDTDAKWGMQPGEKFQLMIGFDSQGWAIPANTPMSLDNFRAGTGTPPVPEPEGYALILGGLATVGWLLRRRQTAK